MKKKIVIDPGHGGTDRANRGPTKYVEADGNLQFSVALKELLKNDFDVVLTREKDVTLSLTARGNMAKGADMFISVHSDAGAPTAGGVTILGSVKLNNKDIGEAIGKAVAAVQGIKYRTFWQRQSEKYPGQDYYTVIGTAQKMGCKCVLLIERGFHSNTVEEKLLLDANIVRKTAEATADEIRKYFKVGAAINLKEALKILQDKKIVNSPAYWEQNAVHGKVCIGDYVQTLIINMAKELK